MISDIYSGPILDAASSIPAERRLAAPDATAKKTSRICGSEVELDLKFDHDMVIDFGMKARACALGQAAASMLAQNIIGARACELITLRNQMIAMLKDGGAPPKGERWQGLGALKAVRDFPQRHASTMLAFEAVVDCISQLGLDDDAMLKSDAAPAEKK